MKKKILTILLVVNSILYSQQKILFDATKAETANNADWVIDSDLFNVKYSHGNITFNGNESNPQRFPTPDQSTVTSTTTEDYWTGGLSAWGIESVQQGWQVETLPIGQQITYGDSQNEQDLSNYDVFVVCEPNQLFTNDEKTALLNFVYNGGNLFMISDHNNSDRDGDGYDSVDVWNDFLNNNSTGGNPFGLQVNGDNIREASTNIAPLNNNEILHGTFGDVTSIEFYNGATFSIDQTENFSVTGLVFRDNVSTTGLDQIMVASVEYGQGKVLAVGDSSIVDDGSGDPNDHLYDGWLSDANGNHRRLIMNAMEWMLNSTNAILINADNQNLKIYAHKNEIHINVKGNYLLKLYDLSGREILQRKTEQSQSFVLPYKGIIFYRLLQNNFLVKVGKLALTN